MKKDGVRVEIGDHESQTLIAVAASMRKYDETGARPYLHPVEIATSLITAAVVALMGSVPASADIDESSDAAIGVIKQATAQSLAFIEEKGTGQARAMTEIALTTADMARGDDDKGRDKAKRMALEELARIEASDKDVT